KVIHYLSYRMRTEKEIRDYLIRNQTNEAYIEQIISKLMEQNLIDDEAFANMFVRNRIQMTTKGPVLVRKELIEKGITGSIASEAVLAFTFEVQYEKAMKVAEKKVNKRSKHSFRKQMEQIQVSLVRKGFHQEVIQEVLREMKEEKNHLEEEEAIHLQGSKLISKHEQKLSGYELCNKVKQSLYRK